MLSLISHIKEALRDTRTQLETAIAAGTIATWIWDISEGKVYGDKNMAKFFGIKTNQVKAGLPTSAYIEAVHNEDRIYIKIT